MASSKATMNLIDKNQYMFSSELPPACKILYDTIINSELDLEYNMGTMEYRLSDAIRYRNLWYFLINLSVSAYQTKTNLHLFNKLVIKGTV